MKLITVIGARPQFIKAATVSRQLTKAGIQEIIIHTGQHYDKNMSDVFFEEMEIPKPHYNLDIHDLGHGAMTGRMLENIETILLKEKPDALLVYGDTNSTLGGALAAAKLHIPVAHVEAGLRSFDMKMPEEINRILTDRISQWLFCPTTTSIKNLENEGFNRFDCEVIQSGDVMYDSVLYYKEKIASRSGILDRLNLHGKDFALATLHRAENTNDPARLASIALALNEIHASTPVILPLHPRTREYLKTHNIRMNVNLIEPVSYFEMLALLENCRLVLTDSGGLQKESYFFGKFCITLRDQTEWIELVEEGVNALAGASTEIILERYHRYAGARILPISDLYGKGDAASIIAKRLAAL